MEELSESQINELQQALLDLKESLQSQLDHSNEATATVTLDQTLVGRVSRMDAMQQQSVALSTREVTTLKMKRVAVALRAIESGDYGFCRRCDEPIGHSRLQAQPEAALCIVCQDIADNQ